MTRAQLVEYVHYFLSESLISLYIKEKHRILINKSLF
jgi:hypothetical protein